MSVTKDEKGMLTISNGTINFTVDLSRFVNSEMLFIGTSLMDRDMAKLLLPILSSFIETGKIDYEPESEPMYYIQKGISTGKILWILPKDDKQEYFLTKHCTPYLNDAGKYKESELSSILKNSFNRAWPCEYIDSLYKGKLITIDVNCVDFEKSKL